MYARVSRHYFLPFKLFIGFIWILHDMFAFLNSARFRILTNNFRFYFVKKTKFGSFKNNEEWKEMRISVYSARRSLIDWPKVVLRIISKPSWKKSGGQLKIFFSPCAEHAGHDRIGESGHLLKLRQEIQLGSRKNDVRGESIFLFCWMSWN